MILIITYKHDFTADFLISKLNQRQIPYKRLNCEDILSQPYRLNFAESFDYSFLQESAFSSVWFRRTKLPEIEDLGQDQMAYILNETESFLKGLFTIIDAKWLSDPFAVYRAEYKLLQLRTAQKLGFTIPRTLITNNRQELISFYN